MEHSVPSLPLPRGVCSRYIDCTSTVGMLFHTLQSGIPSPGQRKPLILLIHGFPEMAFSWRKVMTSLAEPREGAPEGFHVVAFDQRGYGRTTGWEADLPSLGTSLCGSSFIIMQLVRDTVTVVAALGYDRVRCVVGHDFGGVTAGWCACVRDDVFESCVLMSHPWKGTPPLPVARTSHQGKETLDTISEGEREYDPHIETSLASLDPPRKHYKWYSASAPAASDWLNPQPLSLREFLRGYMYTKSAAWPENAHPTPLRRWTAPELARMPWYYVMPQHLSMPQTIAVMLSNNPNAQRELQGTHSWLADADLGVCVDEWSRTGFAGGLSWYASMTDASVNASDVALFAGRKITVPLAFVSGESDWGNWQEPGTLRGMEEGRSCERYWGTKLIEGAGHWVQQERPRRVVDEIGAFLKAL